MNKAELATEVSRKAKVSNKVAKVVVDAVFDEMVKALRRGDRVLLVATIALVLNERTNRESVLLAILLAWHAVIYLSPLRFALIEVLPVRKSRKDTLGSVLID